MRGDNDSTEHLKTEEDMQAYLEACIQESNGDAAFIAKARGMTQLSKETGLGRESLYKALSGHTIPSFDTIIKVVKALKLRLSI